MPTFRDLYDKLAQLSPEQLDTEIRVIPVGYTDNDAAELLAYPNIPYALKIDRAVNDIYYFQPKPEAGEDADDEEGVDWLEASVADFSEEEVKEMGIADDPDYTLICRKGETFLRVDGESLRRAVEVHLGNIDTSILHL